MGQPPWKLVWRLLEKVRVTVGPSDTAPIYPQDKWKHTSRQILTSKRSRHNDSSQSTRKNPSAHQGLQAWTRCGISIQQNIIQPIRQRSIDLCYSTDQLENGMLSERSQPQMVIKYLTALIGNVEDMQICRDQKQICGLGGMGSDQLMGAECFSGRRE